MPSGQTVEYVIIPYMMLTCRRNTQEEEEAEDGVWDYKNHECGSSDGSTPENCEVCL